MARCRYCKAKVSYHARSCPKCGEPHPGRLPEHPVDNEVPLDHLIAFAVTVVAAYFGWKSDVRHGLILYGIIGYVVGWIIGFFIARIAATINGAAPKDSPYKTSGEQFVGGVVCFLLLFFLLWLIFG